MVPNNMRAATWVITITSGVTSAIGIHVMIPSERYAIFLACMAGLAITMLLTSIWTYLFNHTGQKDLRLLLAVPVIIPIIAAISTWSNATALVGPAAMRMHIKSFASEYQESINEAQRRGESNTRIVAAISSEAAAFKADVKGEIEDGRLTGSPGRGTVTITLERIAEKLESMSVASMKASEENAIYINAASESYTRLLILAERDSTRPSDVKEATERLRSAIIKIDEVSPAKTVTAMMPLIAGISDTLLQPKGDGFKKKQLEAINIHIKPRLESMQENLIALAKDASGETVNMPNYDPITRPEAVLKYGDQFPVQWAIAGALDAAPLLFLLLLLLGPNGNKNDEIEELSVTIGDALKIKRALDILELNKEEK